MNQFLNLISKIQKHSTFIKNSIVYFKNISQMVQWLLHNIYLGVIFLDKNENIIYVNKAMYYILGMYTKNQMLLKLFDLKNCHDEF